MKFTSINTVHNAHLAYLVHHRLSNAYLRWPRTHHIAHGLSLAHEFYLLACISSLSVQFAKAQSLMSDLLFVKSVDSYITSSKDYKLQKLATTYHSFLVCDALLSVRQDCSSRECFLQKTFFAKRIFQQCLVIYAVGVKILCSPTHCRSKSYELNR